MGISPARAALAAVALALLALAPAALAHDLPIRHRALGSARLGDDGRLNVDVLLWMEVPAGTHVERLMARFDLLRNGRLDPPEAKALADDRGAEVVGGFVLRVDGAPARPAAADATARLEPDGALSIAVLLSYALAAPAPGGTRLALTLRRETPRAQAGHTREYAGEWSVLPPLVPLDGARVVGPMPLVPGGAGLAVRVAPAAP